MLCFVIALDFLSISISLLLCLTLTLSLPLSLYSFCSGHNTNCDSGIFLGFALFGCCVLLLLFASPFIAFVLLLFTGTTLLTVFLLAIALFVCIICHYCLSGTTILTLINHGIFVLVIALFVYIVSYFSRSGWVHVFLLSVL